MFQIISSYRCTDFENISSANLVHLFVSADFLSLNPLLGHFRGSFCCVKDQDSETATKIANLQDDLAVFNHVIKLAF